MHQQCTLHYLIDLPNYIHIYIKIYIAIYIELLPICVTGPGWGGISNLIALPMASFWHISNAQPEKLISAVGMERGVERGKGALNWGMWLLSWQLACLPACCCPQSHLHLPCCHSFLAPAQRKANGIRIAYQNWKYHAAARCRLRRSRIRMMDRPVRGQVVKQSSYSSGSGGSPREKPRGDGNDGRSKCTNANSKQFVQLQLQLQLGVGVWFQFWEFPGVYLPQAVLLSTASFHSHLLSTAPCIGLWGIRSTKSANICLCVCASVSVCLCVTGATFSFQFSVCIFAAFWLICS